MPLYRSVPPVVAFILLLVGITVSGWLPAPTYATAPADAGSWHLLSATNAPPPRRDAALGYDAARHQLILFGGRGDSGILNDTWLFDLNSSTWQNVATTVAPPARFSVVAGVDSPRNRFLLTTGQKGSTFFNDVWSFDLLTNTWSQVAAQGAAPAPRYGSAGGIANGSDSLYLSHGFTDEGRFDDTWQFDLPTNTWREVTPNTPRPLPRCLHAASIAEARGVVLFGGCASGYGPCPLNDTWLFDTTTQSWGEIATPSAIDARLFPALVSLGTSDKMLLFGGQGDKALNDSWVLDVATRQWTEVQLSGDAPAGRYGHNMVWIPESAVSHSGMAVLFGGKGDSASFNDLWLFDPDTGSAPLDFALFLPILHGTTD